MALFYSQMQCYVIVIPWVVRLHQCNLAHHKAFLAKVGKGGINDNSTYLKSLLKYAATVIQSGCKFNFYSEPSSTSIL